MNRCANCGAPVSEGVYTCAPDESYDGNKLVRFNGCHALPVAKCVSGGRSDTLIWAGVFGRKKAYTPVEVVEPYPVRVEPYLLLPRWSSDSVPKSHRHIKRPEYEKYKPGSMWTNDRYGVSWSVFTTILRSFARKRRISLTGFHVSTLAEADMVDGLLTTWEARV